MGAWGTGLYSDDTTCDVRDDYVLNLKLGLSSEESSQKILDRYGDLLEKTEIACLVYLLWLTQHGGMAALARY